MRFGGRIGAWVVLAWLGGFAPIVNATATRIASLNLCTDSMLLELVPRERIATVTRLAEDASLSALAARAIGIPLNHGLAEEIVALAPDLIVSSQAATVGTNALLQRLHYHLEIFTPPRSLDLFRSHFLRLAALTATEDRARDLLATMDARLAPKAPPLVGPRDALLIEAGGYVPGPETLADDLIAAAGLNNAAADYGVEHGGFLALEKIVSRPPSWLLIGITDPQHPALASDFLTHPALRRALTHTRVIAVPEALWACGGTYFASAVEQIRTALATTPPAEQ